MPEKAQKTPLIDEGSFEVKKVVELNSFDLTGERTKTKGTSNKSYHAELQYEKNGHRAQIYTMWGPTGGNQTKDWRHYSTQGKAEREFESIIKSKKRKGYKEIDVAQRAYGSEAAKQIIKAVTLKNADTSTKPKSNLHPETQRLIGDLMGATSNFVITTLKCPLGQLTNQQIEEGRQRLKQAEKIVSKKRKSQSDKNLVIDLTNEFYALIPHNLGVGARGKMTELLLDSSDKIMKKYDDLDTLLDAKAVGAVLNNDAGVDAQYKELNAEFNYIDRADPIFKFAEAYLKGSANSRHGFGDIRLKNLWSVTRLDSEKDYYLKNTDRIAKECGVHTFVKEARDIARKDLSHLTPAQRPDLDQELRDLYTNANVWLCWHGTRSANVCGITKKGLLVRPRGVVHTGSMLGDGKYFAWQSTKSLNYCDNGYWTGNNNSISSRYMFLLDVALGKQYIQKTAHFFKAPPNGYHSIYGKAGISLRNDEMVTYDFTTESTQSRIKYLLEIV